MRSLAPFVVVLVACHATRPAPPAPRPAIVRVNAQTCLAPRDVETAIDRVLADHHAERSGLVVDVSADDSAGVALRVTAASGELGLERSYNLAANDCASAPQLLSLAVDRWLTSFPSWAEPPAPPAPRPERWFEADATAAISAIAPPLGVEGEAGALADVGGATDRFGTSLAVRSGLPQHAGEGRFREIALLAGAVWRHRFARLDTRLELRGGVVRANGIGFVEDAASWVPWWEVAAFAGRRWSWGSLGGEVAATALRDHAVTRDGLVSQDIPLVRIGISGTFELFGP